MLFQRDGGCSSVLLVIIVLSASAETGKYSCCGGACFFIMWTAILLIACLLACLLACFNQSINRQLKNGLLLLLLLLGHCRCLSMVRTDAEKKKEAVQFGKRVTWGFWWRNTCAHKQKVSWQYFSTKKIIIIIYYFWKRGEPTIGKFPKFRPKLKNKFPQVSSYPSFDIQWHVTIQYWHGPHAFSAMACENIRLTRTTSSWRMRILEFLVL